MFSNPIFFSKQVFINCLTMTLTYNELCLDLQVRPLNNESCGTALDLVVTDVYSCHQLTTKASINEYDILH